jgi:predicted RNA-binding Zn-ribbon protein involved in translation (DUF1610 family)
MKSGYCPKCGHNEVVRSKAAEDSRDGVEFPMSITAEPRLVWPGRNLAHPYGNLHTYICISCGFTEWYVPS